MTQDKDILCLGVITGAHGIRGAVKVKSFTEDPAQLTSYGPLRDDAGVDYNLSIIGQSKGQLIAKIAEVKDRNKAETLKGTELFIDRDKLPEADDDEFYHADLVGLKALEEDGEEYGVVTALFNFGAGDILELRRYDGKSVMLPFSLEVVPTVNISEGTLVVIPPAEVSERDVEAEEIAAADQNNADGGENTDGVSHG